MSKSVRPAAADSSPPGDESLEHEMPPADIQHQWQPSLFECLHKKACAALRGEGNANSLQPTMLADDAYLYLLKQRNIDMADRPRALAAASQWIRRFLIDRARYRNAEMRDIGERARQPLSIVVAGSRRVGNSTLVDSLALEETLQQLEEIFPRQAEVFSLRFFGNMTHDEVAKFLGIGLRTAKKDWSFARAWIGEKLDLYDAHG